MNCNKDNMINYDVIVKNIGSINNFDINQINKIILDNYNFKSKNITNINTKLLQFTKDIDRYTNILSIFNIIKNKDMSVNIENGIFEFSILHVISQNIDYKYVVNVYNDKSFDIIHNLTNNYKYLFNSMENNIINPYFLAFLSPHELNPEKWMHIINKKEYMINRENNMSTTDKYQCSKCGERKSKVTELQTRGADEPATLFITCLVCFKTFRK